MLIFKLTNKIPRLQISEANGLLLLETFEAVPTSNSGAIYAGVPQREFFEGIKKLCLSLSIIRLTPKSHNFNISFGSLLDDFSKTNILSSLISL